MKIIVNCPDHHRREAEVERKPSGSSVLGTVKIAGKIIPGHVTGEGLEFQFTPSRGIKQMQGVGKAPCNPIGS